MSTANTEKRKIVFQVGFLFWTRSASFSFLTWIRNSRLFQLMRPLCNKDVTNQIKWMRKWFEPRNNIVTNLEDKGLSVCYANFFSLPLVSTADKCNELIWRMFARYLAANTISLCGVSVNCICARGQKKNVTGRQSQIQGPVSSRGISPQYLIIGS